MNLAAGAVAVRSLPSAGSKGSDRRSSVRSTFAVRTGRNAVFPAMSRDHARS